MVRPSAVCAEAGVSGGQRPRVRLRAVRLGHLTDLGKEGGLVRGQALEDMAPCHVEMWYTLQQWRKAGPRSKKGHREEAKRHTEVKLGESCAAVGS